MIREAIARAVGGSDLTRDEAAVVMEEIMTGQATPAQFGALVIALHLKGESVAEIAGFATTMRLLATRVVATRPVVDTCGTGGDGHHTFNISTTAAFVAAGAGATVAKHGNRSMTSKCGSADVLEALGVHLTVSPEQVAICLDEAAFGFMFAQLFHPAMKVAVGPRQEIGVRTIFNLIGPLTNPAAADAQIVGVAAGSLVRKMAEALAELGTRHALVVHGADGMDEISICASSTVAEVQNGQVRVYQVAPEDFELARGTLADVLGGDADANAATTRAILAGAGGPKRSVVLLNAAAALVAADLASDLTEGVRLAARSIDSGAAAACLERLIAVSRRFA